MKIQILGSGCKKCNDLLANAQAAVQQNKLDCEVEKISDIKKIVDMGVLITPALAIDGKVVSSGKVLSVDEILKMLPEQKAGGGCCCCCGNTSEKEESCCSEPEKEEPRCSGESEKPCCCSGKKNNFLKKVLTALLLVFVFGSVLYMIDRENKPAEQASAEKTATASTKAADTASAEKVGDKSESNTLNVYYFYGNQRCFTCNKIEELTRKAVGSSSKARFIPVNIEEKSNEHFIRDFQLTSRGVVMERNGKYEKFEQVWQLVKQPEQFNSYLKEGIERLSE